MAVTTRAAPREQVAILGIGVDRVGMDEAMRRIEEFVLSGEPHVVVTADSSGLYLAQQDSDLRGIYVSADLVTPDSEGVLWAAKRAGKALPERVSGVDLVDRICARSAELGWRVYFLGAAPGVADEAARALMLRHPGCQIVGSHDGYFSEGAEDSVVREIAEAKPDVLLVAMGIPRQEKFISATRDRIRAGVAMGVGGSFDVYAGRTKRAPLWVQRAHLEWLWRTVGNPRKLKKAMTLPKFAWRVLRSKP